jgi:hypothetical protein
MGMGVDLGLLQGTCSMNGMGSAQWSEMMVGQPQMGYGNF